MYVEDLYLLDGIAPLDIRGEVSARMESIGDKVIDHLQLLHTSS